MKQTLCVLLAAAVSACGGSRMDRPSPRPNPTQVRAGAERPLPYERALTTGFAAAVSRGTRTTEGIPGPNYWQNRADYDIEVRIDPDTKAVSGRETVTYSNNSPNTLRRIFVHLHQNLHAEGAIRNEPQEVTGGVELLRVVVDGAMSNFVVTGTVAAINLPRGLAAGSTATLELAWRFTIPQSGAGRMGWNDDNLLYVGYWYPQVAVYDDVVGWHVDPYLGNAEFHNVFANYRYTVRAPEHWLVRGTGELTNAADVLRPDIYSRLTSANSSDDVVHVVTRDDFGAVTRAGDQNGFVEWEFQANNVRDVAFSVTKESNLDALRTPVGDRDGDGVTDYTRVESVWRGSAPKWSRQAEYSAHSIDFLSRYTGIPYPWPHMTAVEGGGIIGGGMEYPMMTIIGDYNERGDSALYYVTAHEEAHMWIPMIVGTDEKRHAWMDEGSTTFHENQARMEYFPGVDHNRPDLETYVGFARSGNEGRIMRWTDHHRPGASGVASYSKPASALVALREFLGEEAFNSAWRGYMSIWAYKHPKPEDFFNYMESATAQDLSWFWHSWYYETWTLDQAIEAVTARDASWTVIVRDLGLMPMPVYLTVEDADGSTAAYVFGLDDWLSGTRTAELELPEGSDPVRVTIDAAHRLPDVDRSNNGWSRTD